MKVKINELKEFGKIFKVLYVEDNREARTQTYKTLSNFFKDITLAEDGQEGLKKYIDFYEESNSFYDLVISDINMPNMNGLEMSSKMLKKYPLQSIIITTAFNEIEYLTQAIEVGVSGFITKPISNLQLITVLHKTCLAISDRKFVDAHVHQMETLTIELEEKCKEITQRNVELERSLRVIDTMAHKEQLSHPNSTKTKEQLSEDIYVKEQISHLIGEDLHELEELHSEIDILIIEILKSTDSIDTYSRENLVNKFSKYASILNQYSFFVDLSKEMTNFSNILQNESLPNDEDTVKNIFMLLESFVFVLGKWQEDLASGDESKINALDASITSDMQTITNMWSQEESDIQNIFDF